MVIAIERHPHSRLRLTKQTQRGLSIGRPLHTIHGLREHRFQRLPTQWLIRCRGVRHGVSSRQGHHAAASRPEKPCHDSCLDDRAQRQLVVAPRRVVEKTPPQAFAIRAVGCGGCRELRDGADRLRGVVAVSDRSPGTASHSHTRTEEAWPRATPGLVKPDRKRSLTRPTTPELTHLYYRD